jgi:hypothetical protein
LAEINTHDFPASIKSNNRRSSSGVQLLWRRAAPVIVLPNLVSQVMAYYSCTVVQTFCRTGRFPIFGTPDLALKRAASAERRIRPTPRARSMIHIGRVFVAAPQRSNIEARGGELF